MNHYDEAILVDEQRRSQRLRHKARQKRSHMAAGWGEKNASFYCRHCNAFVSADRFLSGVGHRNHCPYCLWSRHLDLYQAGDRLSACKGDMRPAALTIKVARDKYGCGCGELMLVHQCLECRVFSYNRIAADDIAEEIMAVYQTSLQAGPALAEQLVEVGIRVLAMGDDELVRLRLFGDSGV